MILTPLQSLGMVALTVLLCAIVMTIIHLYLPHGSKAFIDLKTRVKNLEWENVAHRSRIQLLEERTTNTPEDIRVQYHLDSPDDVMALWDAIVNDARQHQDKRS